MLFIINNQLFAMNANATGTIVIDPYGGTGTGNVKTRGTTDYEATMTEELKEFYDTELLENARVEQFYAQFAKKQALPKNHGTSVEWRKWNTFDKAGQLTEGVVPDGQKFGMSAIHAAINQYGTYATVTDKLEFHAYDDVILGATEEMGASAAETQETLIRSALLANNNIIYCDNVSATGAFVSTPGTPAAMEDTVGGTMSRLTSKMVAKAVTKMKKDRVPTINGKYFAVVHPSVVFDLRNNDPDWTDAHKYAQPEEIYNGEIGELHGVRFIEDTFAPVLKGSGETTKNGGASYATFFFGKDGFGIIDPEAGSMEMIVHDKSEIGGPLNQFSTIGYKMEFGTAMLYPERVLCLMSASSYSATDAAN